MVAQQGLTEALVYGSWQNWLIAALTLTVVLVLNHKAKGICKLASILIGMLFGYAVALCFGMVSFADVGNAAWFALPEPLHFGLKFDPASCVAIGLLFAINSIQAIGDFTATTVGGLMSYIKGRGNWKSCSLPNYQDVLAVGDVIFCSKSHVAIYAGGTSMIHAPVPGKYVCYANVYACIGGGFGG